MSKCKNRGRLDGKEEREECSCNVALQAGHEWVHHQSTRCWGEVGDEEIEKWFYNDEQRWSFFVFGHYQCSCSSTLIRLTGEVEFLHANLLNRKFNTKLRQMQISKDTCLVSHCESDEERSTIWCIRRIHQAAVVDAFHLPHHLQGLFSETHLPLKTLIPTCTLIISRHKFLQASAEANDDIAAPATTGNCHLDVKSREICKTHAAAVKKEGKKEGRKKESWIVLLQVLQQQ